LAAASSGFTQQGSTMLRQDPKKDVIRQNHFYILCRSLADNSLLA